ncbi:Hypothetical predicted protein [Podarcis lilfordi]|uniref:Uncharacterized protein n=1 Tax=Podarcis lilfordi TaxID=74358 RepID=A0AA35KJP8_9SAUR|nr:Hypothetical predicted protein [Podarcis lilfordi]
MSKLRSPGVRGHGTEGAAEVTATGRGPELTLERRRDPEVIQSNPLRGAQTAVPSHSILKKPVLKVSRMQFFR